MSTMLFTRKIRRGEGDETAQGSRQETPPNHFVTPWQQQPEAGVWQLFNLTLGIVARFQPRFPVDLH